MLMCLLFTDCGESYIRAENGTVTSPNFPGPFPSYYTCTWTLEVEHDETIQLSFDHLQMTYIFSDCWMGWEGAVLSVYDGNNTTTLLGRFVSMLLLASSDIMEAKHG